MEHPDSECSPTQVHHYYSLHFLLYHVYNIYDVYDMFTMFMMITMLTMFTMLTIMFTIPSTYDDGGLRTCWHAWRTPRPQQQEQGAPTKPQVEGTLLNRLIDLFFFFVPFFFFPQQTLRQRRTNTETKELQQSKVVGMHLPPRGQHNQRHVHFSSR